MDLAGVVDMHLHSGPDVRPRRLDDVGLAQAARDAGYRAIVLKSHHTITADRAAVAERVVGGVRVFGGVVLNRAVGGINPAAVDAALRMGARQVWMPTVSAPVEVAARGEDAAAGVAIEDADGRLLPAVREVLALVRDAGAILGTGHLRAPEIRRLVDEARAAGVERVLVTHPEHPLVDLSVAEQVALAERGALFERCYCFALGAVPGRPVTLTRIAAEIRAVGPRSTVLATDLGRVDLPHPIEGMSAYLAGLAREGFAPADLRLMAVDNPSALLGL